MKFECIFHVSLKINIHKKLIFRFVLRLFITDFNGVANYNRFD